MYSPQQFPLSGPPYYQHLVSQPEFNTLANIDQQGDNMLCGPRPSYPPPMGSISGGSFPGNHGFHDLQHGFDGFRSGGLCSASSKPSARNRPLSPFSPAVSPQPIGTFGSFGQNVGMVCFLTLFLLLFCREYMIPLTFSHYKMLLYARNPSS